MIVSDLAVFWAGQEVSLRGRGVASAGVIGMASRGILVGSVRRGGKRPTAG